ncbi:hypothetical protein HBO15_21275 [Pseudomonas sp. WS 5111]|nr:hypothetical protein [Pseudomonas sp. WS 5111]
MIHYYNKQMTNAHIIGPITRDVLATEVWRTCPTFPLYSVSSCGRVRRSHSKELVKPRHACNGYYSVSMRKVYDSKQYTVKVARLMVDTYFGGKRLGMNLDHINGNRALNCLFNLRYITISANQRNRNNSVNVSWNGQVMNLMTAIEMVFGASDPNKYRYILKRIKQGQDFTHASIERVVYEAKKMKHNA